jgi:sarcosine oxidase
MKPSFDFVVVGAGCFGAWTAYELLRAGHKVLLVDAFGAAHSRASSGGESRVIRMGYGTDEIYTRWSRYSLGEWQALEQRTGRVLFHRTGMLWMTGKDDAHARGTSQTLQRLGIEHERLGTGEIARRFPQIALDGIEWALWEPGSGALMARQSIQTLVAECVLAGLDYRIAKIAPPEGEDRLDHIVTATGETISAGAYIFACGPWLPKVFQVALGSRVFPTRQAVFFFSPPPGDAHFAPPAMPCWFHHPALVYGIPDIENRGFKISIDRHGPPFDPDTGSRVPSSEEIGAARAYLEQRFPKLHGVPLTESRVCQYENTSNGDFILDWHPGLENVVIAGGGSGHGFKHGPAVGDYVARLLTGSIEAEPRFALAAKAAVQERSVY